MHERHNIQILARVGLAMLKQQKILTLCSYVLLLMGTTTFAHSIYKLATGKDLIFRYNLLWTIWLFLFSAVCMTFVIMQIRMRKKQHKRRVS